MEPISLFSPYRLEALRLSSRIVMAPMTRSRAQDGNLPTETMGIYYRQRATAGLIITEGAVISPQGSAYPRVPGLYAEAHIGPWRRITDAVHEAGGRIFAQLWHVGRQSHSSVQPDGALPLAPSPVPILGSAYYSKPTSLPYETPQEMSPEQIRAVVAQYARAARIADRAGFDGVELHAANGYLIDQFLNSSSNLRTDRYGGARENRARFLHEILTEIAEGLPLSRVGVRLSPSSRWKDALDDDKRALHGHVVSSLSDRGLAYLHLVEPEIAGSETTDAAHDDVPNAWLSSLFDGPVIITGGQTLSSATRLLETGTADLVGFGRDFVSNPDLPERLRTGRPLTPPDRRTFYTGGQRGYITYPTAREEETGDTGRSRTDTAGLENEGAR